MRKNPCDNCRQEICDYRRCEDYLLWIGDVWKEFRRFAHHNYWLQDGQRNEKLRYVHPDVIRRYLREGPCGRCSCCDVCRIPCQSYWHWWDARMAWLKWKLEHTPAKKSPPVSGGDFLMI